MDRRGYIKNGPSQKHSALILRTGKNGYSLVANEHVCANIAKLIAISFESNSTWISGDIPLCSSKKKIGSMI